MKPVLAVLSLFLLASLFAFLEFGTGSTTGHIVNELAELRLERIDIIRAGMPYSNDAECLQAGRQVDQLLRLNADDRHYNYRGLNDVETYFWNEKQLFFTLQDIANFCPVMKKRAEGMLINLTQFDMRLVNATVVRSSCFDRRQAIFELNYAVNLSNTLNVSETDMLSHLERASYYARDCKI